MDCIVCACRFQDGQQVNVQIRTEGLKYIRRLFHLMKFQKRSIRLAVFFILFLVVVFLTIRFLSFFHKETAAIFIITETQAFPFSVEIADTLEKQTK